MAIFGELPLEEAVRVFSGHYKKVLQDAIEKEMLKQATVFIKRAAEQLAHKFVAHIHLRRDPTRADSR